MRGRLRSYCLHFLITQSNLERALYPISHRMTCLSDRYPECNTDLLQSEDNSCGNIQTLTVFSISRSGDGELED